MMSTAKVAIPGLPQPSTLEDFTLAHLSDLHLTTLENVRAPQLLNKRILGYFSWRRKRRIVHRLDIVNSLLDDLQITCPDHIAITGDLTHLGLPSEFAEAEKWLTRFGPPEQVTVIPGNHEAYVGQTWHKSCDLWAPYLASSVTQEIPKTHNFFPSLRIFGHVALIGLCSARPSLPLLAIGSLGEKQLASLNILLKKTGEAGFLRIILIHHPPVPGSIKWRKRLVDSKSFVEIISRHGAELILHGHAHIPIYSEIITKAGSIPVIGVPSASELSPGKGRSAKYNIYRLSKVGTTVKLTIMVRGYLEAKGRFELENETTTEIKIID